jgi:hypothetical protein
MGPYEIFVILVMAFVVLSLFLNAFKTGGKKGSTATKTAGFAIRACDVGPPGKMVSSWA